MESFPNSFPKIQQRVKYPCSIQYCCLLFWIYDNQRWWTHVEVFSSQIKWSGSESGYHQSGAQQQACLRPRHIYFHLTLLCLHCHLITDYIFCAACNALLCMGGLCFPMLLLMKAVFAQCIEVSCAVTIHQKYVISARASLLQYTMLRFAAVSQRVFPGSAGGLLGISLQLTLFIFSTCLTIIITSTTIWFLEIQKRKENYQWFTWTTDISVTSWLLLNETETISLIWSHKTPLMVCTQCDSIMRWIYQLLLAHCVGVWSYTLTWPNCGFCVTQSSISARKKRNVTNCETWIKLPRKYEYFKVACLYLYGWFPVKL